MGRMRSRSRSRRGKGRNTVRGGLLESGWEVEEVAEHVAEAGLDRR
jgi:hypothetical protein